MSRYERSTFFEKLVELQAVYAARGAEDRVAVMTIAEVEAFADHVFMAHVFAAASATEPLAVDSTTDATSKS